MFLLSFFPLFSKLFMWKYQLRNIKTAFYGCLHALCYGVLLYFLCIGLPFSLQIYIVGYVCLLFIDSYLLHKRPEQWSIFLSLCLLD